MLVQFKKCDVQIMAKYERLQQLHAFFPFHVDHR